MQTAARKTLLRALKNHIQLQKASSYKAKVDPGGSGHKCIDRPYYQF